MALIDELWKLVDVTRAQWGARPSARPRKPWPPGTPSALEFHHSVTPASQSLEAACRSIQNYHLDKQDWADAFYNVALHPDGRLAELAPWGKVSGSGLPSFTVCLIGNYNHDQITFPQAHKIDQLYRLLPHNMTYHQERAQYLHQPSTECCGRNAIEWVRLRRLSPPTPVTPPPPPPAWHPHEFVVAQEGDMVSKLVSIAGTDDQGNGWGWVNLDGKGLAIGGVTHHGPYPPVDGYWPSTDGTLSAQLRDGNVIVTITGAAPKRPPFAVWVSALVRE